jgi:hypothetical protein
LLVVAIMGASGSAVAQQPPPEAAELFREGVAALRAQDHARAADAFRRSWELDARVATMCNLALTYDQWPGHEELAVQAYDRCARDDSSGRFRDHALERSRVLREEHARSAGTASPSGPGPVAPDPFVGPATPAAGTAPPPSGGPWGITPEQAAAEPERSHGLLYGGLVAAGLGAVSFGVGLALITDARADEAYLADTYDDGAIAIPRGSPDAALLSSADSQASTGVVLYVVAGALAALGATLIVIDLTMPAGTEHSPYSARLDLTPMDGGGMVSGRVRF